MKLIRSDDKLDLDALLQEASKIKRWTPIGFGKYGRLTFPELIFLDPGYFYWALNAGDIQRGQLRFEAMIVAERLKHMRVPGWYSDSSVFRYQTSKEGCI